MKSPPRDAENKQIIPHDHEEIHDEDFVIRRVSEKQIVPDKNTGRRRISTLLYKDQDNNGLSIDLKKLIESKDLDPKKYVTTPRWIGSVLLPVQGVRHLGCKVGFNPLDDNPYHGEIWGASTKKIAKKLSALAHWFVPINDIDLR
jgi:hypothetical protein